jgi:predicted phage terminase large subunit-like protein
MQSIAHQADLRLADAICRRDLTSFIRRCFHSLAPSSAFDMNWHIEAMAYRLEQVRRGKITRLIINMPSRSLKSIASSVALPAYVLGHDPTKRVISISYGIDLATKHANDCRAIVNSPWYQRMFPQMRVSRTKNTELEIVTTRGGFRLATSIEGTLTGRGGDFFIIDDPLKSDDVLSDSKREAVNRWFPETLLGRLDHKTESAIIVVMQRLHTDDLVGRLLQACDEWTVLSIPALAEHDETIQLSEHRWHHRRAGDVLNAKRDSGEALELLRNQVGPEIFAAQHQQSPIPPGGAMIKRDWVRRYDSLPPRDSSSSIVQSWDTASTAGEDSNFSACTTWLLHQGKFYLIDVLRGRFDYPTLRDRAISHARQHRPNTILIENTGVGMALIAELQRAGLSPVAVTPEHDKLTRMSVQSAKFRNGEVFFPTVAPGLTDLEAELFAFPRSRYDDQVDSICQALAHQAPQYGWSDASLNGLNNLCQGLGMLRALGRPW